MTVPLVTLTIEIPVIFTNIFRWNNFVEISDNQPLFNGVTTPVRTISATTPIYYSFLLLVVYVSITSFFLFRLLKNFGQMLLRGRKNACKDFYGATIALFDEKSAPYSFGQYIFLNRDDYNSGQVPDEIMLHELTHIRQRHTYDILFIELLVAFGWFNPVFYLYRNKIKQNHEFLADEAVIDSNRKLIPAYQTMLINHIPQKIKMTFTSNFKFNYLLIKKRIIMMTKATSKKKAWCTIIALIPIFTAAFFVFSNCTFSSKTSDSATIEEITVVETVVEDVQQRASIVEEEITEQTIFESVEEMPEFPGGMPALVAFLSNNMIYPVIAQENGIQGRVTVSFIINQDGSIVDAVVVRPIDPSLDREALRVVNMMPKWIPGKQRGKAVRVRFNVPVTFRLQ